MMWRKYVYVIYCDVVLWNLLRLKENYDLFFVVFVLLEMGFIDVSNV